MSDLGFLPRMIAIKLNHFGVYGDDIPMRYVEEHVREIITNFNANDLEKQRHEEVKRMAAEIFLEWNTFHEPKINPATAWENAEDFYKFVKEKEDAMENM